jgi:hypothetical protein
VRQESQDWPGSKSNLNSLFYPRAVGGRRPGWVAHTQATEFSPVTHRRVRFNCSLPREGGLISRAKALIKHLPDAVLLTTYPYRWPLCLITPTDHTPNYFPARNSVCSLASWGTSLDILGIRFASGGLSKVAEAGQVAGLLEFAARFGRDPWWRCRVNWGAPLWSRTC